MSSSRDPPPKTKNNLQWHIPILQVFSSATKKCDDFRPQEKPWEILSLEVGLGRLDLPTLRAKASDSCKHFNGEEHGKDLGDAGGGRAVMVNHGVTGL